MANRFEIVDDPDDAETADAVVCRRLTSPLLLPDNLIDLCSKCGEAIQHRPHVPKTPPKICDECALPIEAQHAAKGELIVMITPKTAAEVDAYFRKKNAN
jgi:predicted amidophosphoribosyltransferase